MTEEVVLRFRAEGVRQTAQQMKQLEKEFGTLDRAAGRSKKFKREIVSAGDGLDEFGESAETAGKAGSGLALIMANKMARGARKATAGLVGLAEIGVGVLAGGIENLGRQLQAQAQEMKRFGAAASALGHTMEALGNTVEQVAHGLTLFRLTVGAVTVGTMAAAIKSAENFEGSFNRIETVLPDTRLAVTALRSEIGQLAAETGMAAETANKTMFKALTRMPRLAEDTDKALKLVRTALEAGSTGFTTATQAVETYEGVLQGFNLTAENAEEISSKLFKTQELAGTSFSEIAGSIGDVASITDALGGEFEELLAVYATLVPTGQSVSQVTTQLRGVISGIIDPTSEAREELKGMDLDMSAAAVRSKGLLVVIEDIIEATEGDPEVISKLFGRRQAVTLLTTIADRLPTVRDRLDEINASAGEHADTVDTMNESLGRLKARIGKDLQNTLQQLGFALNEMLGRPMLAVLDVTERLTSALSTMASEAVQAIDKLDAAVEEAGGIMALMTVEGMGRFGAAMARMRAGGAFGGGEPVPFPQGPMPAGGGGTGGPAVSNLERQIAGIFGIPGAGSVNAFRLLRNLPQMAAPQMMPFGFERPSMVPVGGGVRPQMMPFDFERIGSEMAETSVDLSESFARARAQAEARAEQVRQMTGSVIGAVGGMVQAVASGFDNIASIVIRTVQSILSSLSRQGGPLGGFLGGLAGPIFGAVGGIISAVAGGGGSSRPQPVEIKNREPIEVEEQQPQGPETVILQVVSPDGDQLGELQYQLNRRSRRDATARVPSDVFLQGAGV